MGNRTDLKYVFKIYLHFLFVCILFRERYSCFIDKLQKTEGAKYFVHKIRQYMLRLLYLLLFLSKNQLNIYLWIRVMQSLYECCYLFSQNDVTHSKKEISAGLGLQNTTILYMKNPNGGILPKQPSED